MNFYSVNKASQCIFKFCFLSFLILIISFIVSGCSENNAIEEDSWDQLLRIELNELLDLNDKIIKLAREIETMDYEIWSDEMIELIKEIYNSTEIIEEIELLSPDGRSSEDYFKIYLFNAELNNLTNDIFGYRLEPTTNLSNELIYAFENGEFRDILKFVNSVRFYTIRIERLLTKMDDLQDYS